jgi:RnfABCDGE-type electron transport complex D subunit
VSDLLNVSASPHVRSNVSTNSIMRDVALALVPASLFGIYNFGFDALLVILVTIATCVLTEYTYQKLMHKKVTTSDFSALVTGLLLALNLPSSVPLWIPIIGGVFAILVVKQLYGGLGQNFMNPALAARCFLLISFTGRMTTFTLDGVTGPTPLALLKFEGKTTDLGSMFIGTISGTIGETSVVALLIGAAYLLAKRIITLRIPATYIGSFVVFILLFGGKGFDMNFLLTHLCGGGLILGAFFMATDYVTSPITPMGQIVFGVLLGVLTGIFRLFGGTAEGVSYAIIFCNLLVPLIEKATLPKAFGKERVKHEQ